MTSPISAVTSPAGTASANTSVRSRQTPIALHAGRGGWAIVISRASASMWRRHELRVIWSGSPCDSTQGEERPLVGRQDVEGCREASAVVGRPPRFVGRLPGIGRPRRPGRPLRRRRGSDLANPAPAAGTERHPGRVDSDPREPGVEPVRVLQPRDLPP
jgi:hypothetical protein